MKKNKKVILIAICMIISILSACSKDDIKQETKESTEAPTEKVEESKQPEETDKDQESNTQSQTPKEDNKEKEETKNEGKVIAIDAGHQENGDSTKEPLGPGSNEMKTKVASGTSGVATKKPEYKLTLEVALKLQAELEKRHYKVVMIRTTHNVNISNRQRADIANKAKADAFIRIHANGADDSTTTGAMTICQTSSNPYNADKYKQSKRLSECVLDSFVEATNCKREKVWETDTMSGINWASVPVTIIEMGYMSNPDEDKLMSTDSYQDKMVTGMVNGLEKFLKQ